MITYSETIMAKSKNTTAQSGAKNSAKTDAEKREALRGKIAAAEKRQAQRSFADQAKDAADSALGYVRANPLKTVAAVAASALVIGALTRPGRRAGRKAGALAGVATDAALAYGLSLLDSAGSAASKGQDKLADLGGSVGDKARAWQSAAAKEGSQLSDYLVEAARRSGKRAGKSIDDLRSRLRH
jgi:ElaB/YqjD/DUF883 family membrane-anchored ribosome-binding protein